MIITDWLTTTTLASVAASQGGVMRVDEFMITTILVDYNVDHNADHNIDHNVNCEYLLITMLIVMQISDVKTRQASTAITAVMTLLSGMADGKYFIILIHQAQYHHNRHFSCPVSS